MWHLAAATVAGRGLASPGVGGRWLLAWLLGSAAGHSGLVAGQRRQATAALAFQKDRDGPHSRIGRRYPLPQQRFLYKKVSSEAYNVNMDVAVSELRAHLSHYLDRAREGDEVVITDRGVPIARMLGMTATTTLERLVADGVIARAAAPRPRASGRHRPRSRRPVADLVSDQRR
jgi:prevent-host-death family protein